MSSDVLPETPAQGLRVEAEQLQVAGDRVRRVTVRGAVRGVQRRGPVLRREWWVYLEPADGSPWRWVAWARCRPLGDEE